jgi:phage shock protein PspC (stress-responsive transcriptional regulator)
MVAGVASGIADHFGWDPSLVRFGFLLSLLLGGSGLFAYLIAAIVIPEEGEVVAPSWRRRITKAPTWLLVVGAVIAGIGVLSEGTWNHPGWFAALILFGIGAMLLHESSPSDRRPRPGSSGTETTVPPPDATTGVLPAAGYHPPTTATYAPYVRREPSPLGLYTVGAALLAVAAAAGIDRLGWFDMDLGRYTALPLLVLGLGLVMGAFRGRGRALIPLGLLLMPFVLVAGVVHLPLRGFVGERHYLLQGEVGDHTYEMLAGETQLDLGEATTSKDAHIDMHMVFGRLTVFVPEAWSLDLNTDVDIGTIDVSGWVPKGITREGTNVNFDRLLGPSDAENSVSLDIDAGIAEVVVVRTPTPAGEPGNGTGSSGKDGSK